MRYIVQIQQYGRWVDDGAYNDIESAKDYAQRCFYGEGLDARVVVETVEVLAEYSSL